MDGEIWTADHTGRLSQEVTIPVEVSERILPGNLAIGERWLVFTQEGSFVFNTETHRLEPVPSEWNVPGGEVSVDNRGNYWVHNKTGKLYYIQSETGTTKVFQLTSPEQVGHVDMERYHVVHDSRDMLWISTYGNGLFTYDLRTEELSHFKASDSRSSLISSDALQFVMEDRSGSIWVSSEFTGISHLKVVDEGAMQLYPEPLENDDDLYINNIRMLAATSDGEVHVGTRDGKVYVYDELLSHLKTRQTYRNNIYAICKDTAGVLWQGSRGDGLFIGGKQHAHRTDDEHSLASNEVFCILRDRKGRMWVGTFGGGLDLAIPDGKGGYRFRHFLDEYYSQKRIRALIEDREGWIWAGTSDGIFVFQPEQLMEDSKAYYHYDQDSQSLLSDEVRSLMQDSDGRVWIAETGSGFALCKPDSGYADLSFTHFGIADGLVNSMVQAFAEDAEGRIWITTEYGVSCFFPQTKSFENYFLSNDMLSNVYSENCALRLSDGRICIGSNQGMAVIDPSQMGSTWQIPTVAYTELKLNGISVASGDPQSPLKHSLAYSRSIRLRYDQNSFSINFSTLDYAAAIPPKYSFLLEGLDESWSPPSEQPVAAYKHLSPGTYRLKVRACNAVGQWDDRYTDLQIVVAPPFWRTW